jgi:hypothetical protein
MRKNALLFVGLLLLSGCATSISKTNYIDAGGHDCLKTFKKVTPLGIPVSESIECSESSSSPASQVTSQKIRKRHWYFLWLF